MTIPVTAAPNAGHVPSPIVISASGWIGSPIGPLSTRELGALRAAVGVNFAWPPTGDGPVPLVAIAVAGRHEDELAAKMKLQELTGKELQILGAAGLLDADAVARGTTYLQQQGGAPDESPATAATPQWPASGTIAADGSRYL
ncbi:MAG: hypothetical protein ACRDQ1_15890 [Sciscionella sp.]